MKLLTVGDLHLDAGADLGTRPGERLGEQEAVWDFALEQARSHHVDVVLFAGDAFQHRRPSVEALLAFERPLVAHRDQNGPRVLAIAGNHEISNQDAGCSLDIFHADGLLELVREPRVVLVDGGARVACLPWAPTSRLASSYDGPRDELNQYAAGLLVDIARYLHTEALPSVRGGTAPLILLTHFSISGTALPSGLDVGQLREPVLPQDELLAIGYDAIVAGHIHRPQSIGTDGIYVGSPMPLNFGEADGCTRGPWIVTLGEPGTATGAVVSGSPSVSFRQLPAPSRRFVNVYADEVFEGQDVEGAYVKLRVHGTEQEVAANDVDALREALLGMGAQRVFVEVQVEREARARDASVDDSVSEEVALIRWLAAQNGRVDHDVAERALARARVYFEQVNA